MNPLALTAITLLVLAIPAGAKDRVHIWEHEKQTLSIYALPATIEFDFENAELDVIGTFEMVSNNGAIAERAAVAIAECGGVSGTMDITYLRTGQRFTSPWVRGGSTGNDTMAGFMCQRYMAAYR